MLAVVGMPAAPVPRPALALQAVLRAAAPLKPASGSRVAPGTTAAPGAPRPARVSRPAATPRALPAADVPAAFSPAAPSPSIAHEKSIEPGNSTAPESNGPMPAAAPPAPRQPDAGTLAAYGQAVAALLARHQRYPAMAMARRWQGTTMLDLMIDAQGWLVDVRVARSSGHEVLDQSALEMARAATPLPKVPEALAGLELKLHVPVVFRLIP